MAAPLFLQVLQGGSFQLVTTDGTVYAIAAPAGGGGGGGTQYVFDLAPGQAPSGNLFADWPTLYAAYEALPGPPQPALVYVDDTMGAAVIPFAPGGYALNEVTFVPKRPKSGTLTIQTGATFAPGTLHFADGLNVIAQAGLVPIMQAVAAGVVPLIDVASGATLSCSGPGVFLDVPAGALAVCFLRDSATLGSAGPPVLRGHDAGNLLVQASNRSHLTAGCLTNVGGGVNFFFDSSCQVDAGFTTFPITPGQGQDSLAEQTKFDPFNAAAWGLQAPFQVGAGTGGPASNGALDFLAAIAANRVQDTPAWGPAGLAITTGTIPFTPTPNAAGVARVYAAGEALASAPCTITATLLLDGVNVGGAPSPRVDIPASLVGARVQLSLEWDVGLLAAGAHTFALEFTATAG